MHALMMKCQVVQPEEVVQKIRDVFEPQISQQPGFVAFFAVQSEKGELFSVSVFETESQAQAASELLLSFLAQSHRSEYVQPPETSTGEIVTSKVKGLPDWVASVLAPGL